MLSAGLTSSRPKPNGIITGNLASNAGVSYTYGDSAHKHAVTGTSNGNIYGYDQNGNQTTRTVGGITYTLIYDAESRLVQIKRGNDIQATYYYDGDNNRVKTVVGSTTTTYVGNYLEWTGSTTSMKKHYYAGGQRVAMRQGSSTLYFLLTDHLGSTAVTATSSGGFSAEMRYYPWGGTRYNYGMTPTSYRYTGQREAEVGLYYYGARFYDPYLNRWVQPDSIIPDPGNPADWDRYSYVRNNPVKYTDPTGHCPEGDEDCWALLNQLEQTYGIDIDTENYGMDGVEVWSLITLFNLQTALERMVGLIGADAFTSMIGGAVFRLDSTLSDIGLYDPIGKNRLTDNQRVISLRPDFYKREVSGYRDSWSPIIHEMWHGVDVWASKNVFGQDSATYFSTHDYATMAGVGPACTPNCNWGNYAWGERPFEDFASIGTLVTNMAASSGEFRMVSSHPDEYWRIYTLVMFLIPWVSQ